MSRRMHRMLVFVLLAAPCFGQEPIQSTSQALASLQEQVRELQQEVKALQSRLDHDSAPQLPPPSAEPEPAAEAPMKIDHGMHIGGFGEINFKALDQRAPELGAGGFVPGSAANVYDGNFDILFTEVLTDRARVLAEVNIQETDAQTFKVDLERLLLNYNFKDWLRPSVGRYQTAIGYYNTVYNNGAWPQTTVDRPLIMEFPDHGGILPVQAVGISFQGVVPSGKLNLN